MPEAIATIRPKSAKEWRTWLQKNHNKETAIWVVCSRKKATKPTLSHDEAVDVALCFGWIDSKANKLDEEHYLQTFTKRKPKSVWSKISKAKIVTLTKQGLMTPAGLESIATAKKNGSWSALDQVEKLSIPADLSEAFDKNPDARTWFENRARSVKKLMLQKLMMAKRPETRAKRVEEIIATAQKA